MSVQVSILTVKIYSKNKPFVDQSLIGVKVIRIGLPLLLIK
jgi:hypothetical protein